jgi:hypothetical protein|tara:strand:- start:784 stop:1170 length:387 start_codon:yes stop_codon:yes gene_type:complete
MIEKVQRFDKPTLKILRNKLQENLEQLSEYGLKIDIGGMTYSDHEVDVKIKILIEGQKSRSQSALVNIADMLDLDLTKIVNRNGKAYSLVDYRPKASVWEFIVQDNKTGKQVLMTRNTITEMFKRECA